MQLSKKILPAGVIVIAFLIAMFLDANKQQAEKVSYQEKPNFVEVLELQPVSMSFPVESQGVVEASKKIRLVSEVTGKLTTVSEKWVNGGLFQQGEVMLTVEDHNYRNQLAKAQATLAQAQSALTQEQGLAYVARQDWERRQQKTEDEASKALALREPQLASAQAHVEAAQADVRSAELSLEKTQITAPFTGLVVKKSADLGQYVSPGQQLAEFYSVDKAEIRIALTEGQLQMIDLKAAQSGEPLSVVVRHSSSLIEQTWQGSLVRTEGIIDPVSKVLFAVVEVPSPYQSGDTLVPLRLGDFVHVYVQGRELDNVYVLPRRALRRGNNVWMLDKDDKLFKKKVQPLPSRDEENIYIVGVFEAGDRLVLSGLVDPVEGMTVSAKTPSPQAGE